MPIVGLTDRGLSFPEIGQIRKGGAKTNEFKPGPDLEHFRVTFDEQEVKAAEAFHKLYGDKPAEIRIVLPFNDVERMWEAWLEAYTAGRLVARSDGERFIYLVDPKSGEVKVKNSEPYMQHKDVVGTYTTQKGKVEEIKCKATGRLKVIIPELGRAAYLTVLTTSTHDIRNISEQLRAFFELNRGQIAGIPFLLRRRPKKISTPGADGKRVRRVKWLLSIEADPEWVKEKLTELKKLALPDNGLALLPEHAEADHEPEDDIVETEVTYMDDDDFDEAYDEPEMEAATEQPKDTELAIAWEKWFELVAKASNLGVTVPAAPDDATIDDLRGYYAELKDVIKAKKAQA